MMDVNIDQGWIRPDGSRPPAGLDTAASTAAAAAAAAAVAGSMLSAEEVPDMFFHSVDGQAASHMNAAGYYTSPAAARAAAVHSYRPPTHHGEFHPPSYDLLPFLQTLFPTILFSVMNVITPL